MKAMIPLLGVLLLTSCARPGPDYSPIGTGLSVIGLCIFLAAVVFCTLGRWDGKDDDD